MPNTSFIQVEFFGVARMRAGCAEITVSMDDVAGNLGAVIDAITEELPALKRECFEPDASDNSLQLRPSYTMNLDGRRFIRARDEPIRAGETLLLLAADAGG